MTGKEDHGTKLNFEVQENFPTQLAMFEPNFSVHIVLVVVPVLAVVEVNFDVVIV